MKQNADAIRVFSEAEQQIVHRHNSLALTPCHNFLGIEVSAASV